MTVLADTAAQIGQNKIDPFSIIAPSDCVTMAIPSERASNNNGGPHARDP